MNSSKHKRTPSDDIKPSKVVHDVDAWAADPCVDLTKENFKTSPLANQENGYIRKTSTTNGGGRTRRRDSDPEVQIIGISWNLNRSGNGVAQSRRNREREQTRNNFSANVSRASSAPRGGW